MENEEIHCIVSGRVQGVMYRDFVKRFARRLGLAGYVRNLAGGTVEVLAQGSKDDLENLLARVRIGSLLSRVDDVRVEWRPATEAYSSFDIVF